VHWIDLLLSRNCPTGCDHSAVKNDSICQAFAPHTPKTRKYLAEGHTGSRTLMGGNVGNEISCRSTVQSKAVDIRQAGPDELLRRIGTIIEGKSVQILVAGRSRCSWKKIRFGGISHVVGGL
jgi:hypothetical protein